MVNHTYLGFKTDKKKDDSPKWVRSGTTFPKLYRTFKPDRYFQGVFSNSAFKVKVQPDALQAFFCSLAGRLVSLADDLVVAFRVLWGFYWGWFSRLYLCDTLP
jgi:hypothetical protein